MHNENDLDNYRQDTLINAEAIMNTVMTRSRAQAATKREHNIRKEELKLLQDLSVNQKYIMVPGLFRQDGTLIENEILPDTEILYDDYIDMQGIQDDITQYDIAHDEIVQNDTGQEENDENLLNSQDLTQIDSDVASENAVLNDSKTKNANDTVPKQDGHIRHRVLQPS